MSSVATGAIRELSAISQKNGHGQNVTLAEFQKLDDAGKLADWKSKYPKMDFETLDTNGSGRISVEHDLNTFGRSSSTGGSSSGGGSATRSDSSSNGSSSRSSDNSSESSGDQVVVLFGWSDTSNSKTKSALEKAGIDASDYTMSKTGSDKGVGIAVVSRGEAEKFLDSYNGSKTFAYTSKAAKGIDSIDDLDVNFKVGGGERGRIDFGGNDYGALMTDDPANRTSGGSNVKGRNTGSDSFWIASGGNRGSAKMYEEKGAPNGGQYVKMDVRIK